MNNLTSYPQFYGHNWTRPVAPRVPAKPYVPVRQRQVLPFFTPKPAPVAPSIPAEFAAAFAQLLESYQWVRPHTRQSGTVEVKGYLRRIVRKAVA